MQVQFKDKSSERNESRASGNIINPLMHSVPHMGRYFSLDLSEKVTHYIMGYQQILLAE